MSQLLLFSAFINNIRFAKPGTSEFLCEIRDQLLHHLDPSLVDQPRAPFGAHANDHKLAPRLVMLALNTGDFVPLADASLDRYKAVCFIATSWTNIFEIKRAFIVKEVDINAQMGHQQILEILETSKAVDILFPTVPGSSLDEPWTQSSYEARGRTEAPTQLRHDLDNIMTAIRFGDKSPSQIIEELFGPSAEVPNSAPDAVESPQNDPISIPNDSAEPEQAIKASGKAKRKRGKKGKKKGKNQGATHTTLNLEPPIDAAEVGESEDEAAGGDDFDPNNPFAALAGSPEMATAVSEIMHTETPATGSSMPQQAEAGDTTTTVHCLEPQLAVDGTMSDEGVPSFSKQDFPLLELDGSRQSDGRGGEEASLKTPTDSLIKATSRMDGEQRSKIPEVPISPVENEEAPIPAETRRTPTSPPRADVVLEPAKLPSPVPALSDAEFLRRLIESRARTRSVGSPEQTSTGAQESPPATDDNTGTDNGQKSPAAPPSPKLQGAAAEHPSVTVTPPSEYLRGWLAGYEYGRWIEDVARLYNTSHRGRGRSKSI